jgi:hypothetical protein
LDWLSFISADIKSLAWPIAAIVALLVLKRHVIDLLRALGNRLEKAKGAGIELTFGKGIDKVEEILPLPDTKIDESIVTQRIENASELSHLPPSYIVSQAWLKLEQAIRDTVDMPIRISASIRRQPYRVLDYIDLATRQEFLLNDEVSAVQQLRALRNQAAHSVDPGITITDALRYNDIASSLIEKIKRRRQGKNPVPPT